MDKILTDYEQWKEDLKYGQEQEKILAEYYREAKYENGDPRFLVDHSIDKKKFSDFDIAVVENRTLKRDTIELKSDRKHGETGQIAVEFGTYRWDGTIEPTGILKTKADWFASRLENWHGFWALPTQKFIDYVRENTIYKGTKYEEYGKPGGQNERFLIHLIKREPFLKVAINLIEKFDLRKHTPVHIDINNYIKTK